MATGRRKTGSWAAVIALLGLAAGAPLTAQDAVLAKKLQGFDFYMARILKDWNAPGIGVGIVVGDKLAFFKGYGYRDHGRKLPITEATLFQIASNTKLFTAVAAGMLVEEGRLTWDQPVRDAVPGLRFSDDRLNASVTLRDMLSHRTGIAGHDVVWFQTNDTRKQLVEKIKYLEPSAPLRQTFLYNNLMYAAVGYLLELRTGKTWEALVRDRILDPLGMTSTVFTVADMRRQADRVVHFNEKRDGFELTETPYYEDQEAVGPCGALISNIRDLSHWLSALMNDGQYGGRPVLPPAVLKETLAPAIAIPNVPAESQGFQEILSPAYGMGRSMAVYRGHPYTSHGGALSGIHSQISFLPGEKIGVIVFAVGDHCAPLVNAVTYNIYERWLGLDETPWSRRSLETRLRSKKADVEARAKAGESRVPGTRPSHALDEYVGSYAHPAYGDLKITLENGRLQFDFHKIKLPLDHFHYDRFDTPNDERYGMAFSVNFRTNPQGDIDSALMTLAQDEGVFSRQPDRPDPRTLATLPGVYQHPAGLAILVALKDDGTLSLEVPGQPVHELLPYKGLRFRIKAFSDTVFEFLVEDGRVKALKQISPSGEVLCPRK